MYTQYTIFKIKKENHPKVFKKCGYGIFSKKLKREFETAVVNEPSVFEPMKFYCKCNLLPVLDADPSIPILKVVSGNIR